jgi:hypothetical protein
MLPYSIQKSFSNQSDATTTLLPDYYQIQNQKIMYYYNVTEDVGMVWVMLQDVTFNVTEDVAMVWGLLQDVTVNVTEEVGMVWGIYRT